MAQKVYCGVPEKICFGANHIANAMLNHSSSVKLHANSEEAFKCYKRWLVLEGYEQIGPREFRKEGEPIRVLTRKSKFGTKMKSGKSKDGSSPGSTRYVPQTTRGFVHIT